jgi:hypothetical protein
MAKKASAPKALPAAKKKRKESAAEKEKRADRIPQRELVQQVNGLKALICARAYAAVAGAGAMKAEDGDVSRHNLAASAAELYTIGQRDPSSSSNDRLGGIFSKDADSIGLWQSALTMFPRFDEIDPKV